MMKVGKQKKEKRCSRFTSYQFEKLSKNIVRVMRTRGGFGMELHAEYGFVLQAKAFERIIVQALVRDLHFGRIQITFRNTIIMILGCDQNFTRWQMTHGVISAVMTKLEPVRICAERASDQLVTETDTENGSAAFDQTVDRFDSVGQPGRVTRTVRQKHAIGFHLQYSLSCRIRRDHGHLRAVTGQMTQDVFLDAK